MARSSSTVEGRLSQLMSNDNSLQEVVGSRGYGPVRRTPLGAVSSGLMHQATCPVLVLPRQAGDDPLHLKLEGATA